MKTSRVVEVCLACYPAWWRERYEEEVRGVFTGLMAHGQTGFRVASSLLLGAVSARLKARNLPKSSELWAVRTSSSIAASTIPWLIVQPILLVLFVGATTWNGGPPLSQVPAWPPAKPIDLFSIPPFAGQTWGLFLALLLVWLASTLVMACGWARLVMGITKSSRSPRRRTMLVAMAPALSFLAGTALYIAIVKEAWPGPRPASFRILLVSFWVIVLVGAFISSWSIAFITKRVPMPIRTLQRGKRIAGITSVTLFVIAALFTAIGVVASYGPTESTFFNELVVQHAVWWFSSSALLFLATFISIGSFHIARRSFRNTLLLSVPLSLQARRARLPN